MTCVHLEDFEKTPPEWLDEELNRKWIPLREIRKKVTSHIEIEREKKTIGSSLEVAPILDVPDEKIYNYLASVDFADICITSGMTLSKKIPLDHIPLKPEIKEEIFEA